MKQLQGKYTNAVVFTDLVEQEALERLETVMEQAGEVAHSDWVPFDELVNNTFAQNAVR